MEKLSTNILKSLNEDFEEDYEAEYKDESLDYENILDRVVEIEDYNGNTIMAFRVDNKGKIVEYRDCNVADVDTDYIFETDKYLVRIQKD